MVDEESMRNRTKVKFENGKSVRMFSNGIHISKLNYCREILYGKCLRSESSWVCLKKSRMERIFDQGRERLKEEIDVINILTQLRTINATLAVLRRKIYFTKDESARVEN